MTLRKTFVDAGVLIAAARGKTDVAVQAMKILDDPSREFIASPFSNWKSSLKQSKKNAKMKLNFMRYSLTP